MLCYFKKLYLLQIHYYVCLLFFYLHKHINDDLEDGNQCLQFTWKGLFLIQLIKN